MPSKPATTAAGIVIEEVRDPARLVAMERLQMDAWGMSERDVAPANLMQIIASSGGILLAAYDGDRAVGFVLSLLARRDGRLYQASHILATDPAYQGRGVGAALKWRQRDYALAQGIDLMTWTFDPLIARNAHFNVRKLGAVSNTYYDDYYGPMDDDYNRGLPTDRLLVEWRLRAPASPPRDSVPRVYGAPTPILVDDAGAPALRLDDAPAGAPLAAHIPADIGRLRERDADAALAWRLALRRALSWAFARGYTARDFADGAYLLVLDESA